MSRPEGVHQNLVGGIKKSRVGLYKMFFSARDIAPIESVAGEGLKMYGYSLETDGASSATHFDRFRWSIREWLHKTRYSFINTPFFHQGHWQIRFRKWSGGLRRIEWRLCGK